MNKLIGIKKSTLGNNHRWTCHIDSERGNEYELKNDLDFAINQLIDQILNDYNPAGYGTLFKEVDITINFNIYKSGLGT